IRDFHVTGVQTCALPIYQAIFLELQMKHGQRSINSVEELLAAARDSDVTHIEVAANLVNVPTLRLLPGQALFGADASAGIRFSRSEERRVGKGCRSRWSP